MYYELCILFYSSTAAVKLDWYADIPLLLLPSGQHPKHFLLLKPIGCVSPKTTQRTLNLLQSSVFESHLFPRCYTA